jgi:hypothetical protein
MGFFKPCWSCHSNGPCYDGCECAKCVDPEGYEEWKQTCPDEYEDWLERQRTDDDWEWDD